MGRRKVKFVVEVTAPADIPVPLLRTALAELIEAGQTDLELSLQRLDKEDRMGCWEEAAKIEKIEVKHRPLLPKKF